MKEPFFEKEEATTTSKVVGITPGDPPRITLVDHVPGPRGVMRHFTQQVPIRDATLFQRLRVEVRTGDEIRATVVNEYSDLGSVTYLAGFTRVTDAGPQIVVKSGAADMSRSDITQVAIPSARHAKAKARK